jgi:hypothetical protein
MKMTSGFRPAALAFAFLMGALPITSTAQAQIFTVDCARGQTVSRALEEGDSRKPMLLTVRGPCSENVTIRRDDVTLQGQAGGNATLTAANASAPLLTIRGTRIVVDGLILNGGTQAVAIDGTHNVLILNAVLRNAALYGLSITDGHASVQNSTVTLNRAGGIYLRGSRARLERNQIQPNLGPGIWAVQNAGVSTEANTITGNAQGILLGNGSTGALASDTIGPDELDGIELGTDSRAYLSGLAIGGNDNGVRASFSQVSIEGGSIAGNRRSGLFLVASRAEVAGAMITGNGNQGIGGSNASTLVVSGGTLSGNGRNGVSISNNGTVSISSGTTIHGNGDSGIFIRYATMLMLGGMIDATGNGIWGLDCMDGESSFAGGTLVGPIAPSCTGYQRPAVHARPGTRARRGESPGRPFWGGAGHSGRGRSTSEGTSAPAVGVAEAQRAQQLALARLHHPRRARALVLPALRVQRPMDQQVRVVRLDRDALRACLSLDHRRAQHEVGHDHRLALVVEGEHVGRVVLAAIVSVEHAALGGIDDAHRNLRVAFERRADPARNAVPRQQGPMPRVGKLQRELQRRPARARHPGPPAPDRPAGAAGRRASDRPARRPRRCAPPADAARRRRP